MAEAAEGLYQRLTDAGVEVLYDDRDESAGVKFTDAELLGMPTIVTISPRSLAAGGAEVTDRATGERGVRPIDEVAGPARRAVLSTRYAGSMPRDPNIPDAFDVFTLVLLRRPPDAPQMPDAELDALQVGTSPTAPSSAARACWWSTDRSSEQSDEAMRGLSIFACDLAEAARLSDGDPSVQAGRLAYDLMEWWVAAGTLAFPEAPGPVGDRRAMPDD